MKNMKKTLAFLLLMALISSMTACSNSSNNTNSEDNSSIGTEITTTPEVTTEPEVTTAPEVNTEPEQATLEGSPVEIIDRIYEQKPIELRVATQELDLTNANSLLYNTGLESAASIKEAAVSEAMIGSQAYSLIVVRVDDVNKTSEIANQMLNGINPAKWICVNADDLQVATYNDVILLIMVSSQFEEYVTSNDIVQAFETVCGNTLDETLKK